MFNSRTRSPEYNGAHSHTHTRTHASVNRILRLQAHEAKGSRRRHIKSISTACARSGRQAKNGYANESERCRSSSAAVGVAVAASASMAGACRRIGSHTHTHAQALTVEPERVMNLNIIRGFICANRRVVSYGDGGVGDDDGGACANMRVFVGVCMCRHHLTVFIHTYKSCDGFGCGVIITRAHTRMHRGYASVCTHMAVFVCVLCLRVSCVCVFI